MNSLCVSGFAEDKTAPQATLHPRGGPAFSPSRPGHSGDPDSYCEAFFLIRYSGSLISYKIHVILQPGI